VRALCEWAHLLLVSAISGPLLRAENSTQNVPSLRHSDVGKGLLEKFYPAASDIIRFTFSSLQAFVKVETRTLPPMFWEARFLAVREITSLRNPLISE
jgi:hypothetical protein